MNPYFIPATNQIKGARKGALVWWHERGHQLIHKKTGYYNIRPNLLKGCVVFGLAFHLTGLYDLSTIFLWAFFLLPGIDESAAWVYAFIKYKKKRTS